MDYKAKYLKYKTKYWNLKGGNNNICETISNNGNYLNITNNNISLIISIAQGLYLKKFIINEPEYNNTYKESFEIILSYFKNIYNNKLLDHYDIEIKNILEEIAKTFKIYIKIRKYNTKTKNIQLYNEKNKHIFDDFFPDEEIKNKDVRYIYILNFLNHYELLVNHKQVYEKKINNIGKRQLDIESNTYYGKNINFNLLIPTKKRFPEEDFYDYRLRDWSKEYNYFDLLKENVLVSNSKNFNHPNFINLTHMSQIVKKINEDMEDKKINKSVFNDIVLKYFKNIDDIKNITIIDFHNLVGDLFSSNSKLDEKFKLSINKKRVGQDLEYILDKEFKYINSLYILLDYYFFKSKKDLIFIIFKDSIYQEWFDFAVKKVYELNVTNNELDINEIKDKVIFIKCKIDNHNRVTKKIRQYVKYNDSKHPYLVKGDNKERSQKMLKGIDDYFIYFLKALINIHYLNMNINVPDINIISKDTRSIKDYKNFNYLINKIEGRHSLYKEFILERINENSYTSNFIKNELRLFKNNKRGLRNFRLCNEVMTKITKSKIINLLLGSRTIHKRNSPPLGNTDNKSKNYIGTLFSEENIFFDEQFTDFLTTTFNYDNMQLNNDYKNLLDYDYILIRVENDYNLLKKYYSNNNNNFKELSNEEINKKKEIMNLYLEDNYKTSEINKDLRVQIDNRSNIGFGEIIFFNEEKKHGFIEFEGKKYLFNDSELNNYEKNLVNKIVQFDFNNNKITNIFILDDSY